MKCHDAAEAALTVVCVLLSAMPGRHKGIGMNKPKKTRVDVPKMLMVKLLLRDVAAEQELSDAKFSVEACKPVSAIRLATNAVRACYARVVRLQRAVKRIMARCDTCKRMSDRSMERNLKHCVSVHEHAMLLPGLKYVQN